MAHASGATPAQISAVAEAEIRRTREQSESVLQQHQRFNTDAHHALEQAMQFEIGELRQAQSHRGHQAQQPYQGDITRTPVSLHRALPGYSPEVSCRQAHAEPAQVRSVNTTPSVDSAHATWHKSGTDFWRDIHGQGRQRHAVWCNAPIQQGVEPMKCLAVLNSKHAATEVAHSDRSFGTRVLQHYELCHHSEPQMVTLRSVDDDASRMLIEARMRIRELRLDQTLTSSMKGITTIPLPQQKKYQNMWQMAPEKTKEVKDEEKTVLCRDFEAGEDECSRGDACPYKHVCKKDKCPDCGSGNHGFKACTRFKNSTANPKGKSKPRAGHAMFDEEDEADEVCHGPESACTSCNI
eukprot:3044065-Amphidinium_carterae.2